MKKLLSNHHPLSKREVARINWSYDDYYNPSNLWHHTSTDPLNMKMDAALMMNTHVTGQEKIHTHVRTPTQRGNREKRIKVKEKTQLIVHIFTIWLVGLEFNGNFKKTRKCNKKSNNKFVSKFWKIDLKKINEVQNTKEVDLLKNLNMAPKKLEEQLFLIAVSNP